MKIFRLPVLFSVLLLAAACGAKQLGTVAPKGATPKDTPQKCGAVMNPSHTLTISFPHGVPAKVGIRFPTDQNNFHASECAQIPPSGPLVSLARLNANTLEIVVDHNHSYTEPNGTTTLPATQSLEIDDLHGCDASTPTPVVKAGTAVQILWKMKFPSGTSCAPALTGTGSGTATPEGAFVPDAEEAADQTAM